MNKLTIYWLLLVFFLGISAFVVLNYEGRLKNREAAFYPLLERQGSSALLPDWTFAKSTADKLIRVVRETPGNKKATLALATLYIQEARVTGNYTYYNAAAMKYVEAVLAQHPDDIEALVLKAILQLSQHHFSDALHTAGEAQKRNPYNAFIYGILVDGNVELGNYARAVESSDKMVSIRPDIRSYSRVSYLRELHGDYPGAIEAMQMAVDAGASGDEASAWARIQLARLYENTGDIKRSEMHYTIAFRERPGYGYALAGLGNIAMGNKDFMRALEYYKQADSAVNDYTLKEKLAELYLLTGQKEKAEMEIKATIEKLSNAAAEGPQSFHHHADKELADIYLLQNDYRKALKHALAEYSRRPDNIDVNETVAWAFYKKGEILKAIPYITAALKTGSKNPVLLSRAGLIFARNGDKSKAKSFLLDAQKDHPNIDLFLKQEADNALKSLGAALYLKRCDTLPIR